MAETQSCFSIDNVAGATVLHAVGVSAFNRGKIDVALRFVSRACSYAEAPAVWHRNLAEILDRSGNWAEAEAAARRAVERDADYADAWDTLGTILAQRNKYAESRECYEKAVQLRPDFVQALNNLAVTLYNLGERKAAETRYRQVLRLMPEHAEIQLNLAFLLAELGCHQEGMQIVLEVVKRSPDSARARSMAAQFRRELNQQAKSNKKHSFKVSKRRGRLTGYGLAASL